MGGLVKFNNTVIDSHGVVLPHKILSSEAIEQQLASVYSKLNLPFGRLELMSGIKERRYWDEDVLPSDLSTQAAQKLFEKTSFKPKDMDLLIHASVCRDYLEPASASFVHKNLNLGDHCPFFDVSNACMGVLNSFVIAAEMIERRSIKTALVVAAENGGPLLHQTIDTLSSNPNLTRKDVKKYFANLTIGSGATAWLLAHRDYSPHSPRLLGGVMRSDSPSGELCRGSGNHKVVMMETDSEKLLQKGVSLTQKTWKSFKKNKENHHYIPDWIIGHQVGAIHQDTVLKALELNHCPIHSTYETLGNTGSCALPITLAQLMDSGKTAPNSSILLIGIGSGLSCAMMEVLC